MSVFARMMVDKITNEYIISVSIFYINQTNTAYVQTCLCTQNCMHVRVSRQFRSAFQIMLMIILDS